MLSAEADVATRLGCKHTYKNYLTLLTVVDQMECGPLEIAQWDNRE